MSPAQPLPAVPHWFDEVTTNWNRYERFSSISGAGRRRQQLERLKQSHPFEIACRTGNPGNHYITARIKPQED